MRRIVYVSTADDLPTLEVERIVDSAQRNNPEREITGFLIYNGRNFLQLIEGPQASLMSLMAALSRDTRHHGMIVLIDEAVAQRCSPAWSMHHIKLGERVGSRRVEILAELPGPLSPDARKLVENFAALN